MVYKSKFLILLIISVAFIILSVNFVLAAACWNYTAQSTCDANNCKWKSDSWGGWCEEFKCWSLTTQTECSSISNHALIGKNCTWTSGGSSNYCSQVSCYTYSKNNQTYCETNPSGRSCQWSSSCYSSGGSGSVNCWNITSQNTCGNTTGCSWGECYDKGCWSYTNSTSCSNAKNPWDGINCTWSASSSSCKEQSCSDTSLYPNQTACGTASNCRWQGSSTSGWCETKNCWIYDGNQTGCNTANTTISKTCVWDSGYCKEESCWSYDKNQTACTQKLGCSWETSTSSSWCEEVNCWTWDSIRGGNQTKCETLDAGYNLTCLWSGNPSGNLTNGWCYKDYSSTSCTNITNEKNCYDTNYCWWQANNWNDSSAGGTCKEPTWGTGNYSNSSIVNNWNPGCYIFDYNSTDCNNIIGCNYTGTDACDPINKNVTGINVTITYIDNNGLNCTMINNSDLCNDIPVLSSCCVWQNGTCGESKSTSSCWSQVDQTPTGETSCEGAATQSICEQLSGTPWYWPCKWDNTTSMCTVKASDIWGNRTQSFVAIENQITCEAIGGKWVTENYCEGNISVPSGRCEYKFDEERNCNKACFACEYKSDGSAHNSSSAAQVACLGSALGYCEFSSDAAAPNSYGYCKAKSEFKTGVSEGCSATNCGGCSYMGNANGINGTKTPEDYCNQYSSSCKWVADNTTSTKGYCVDKSTKICEDSCDRCSERNKCINDGRTNIANQSGTCKWQGTDNDGSCVANTGEDVEICWNGEDDNNNNLMDCADPGCFGDSFCGFVGGECSVWSDKSSCETNKCEWVADKWGSWCEHKGTQCWKYDKNQTSCEGTTQVNSETLNITSARLAGNAINESRLFGLANNGTGWVTNSFTIQNATGAAIGAGNYTINYTTKKINFLNTNFMNTTNLNNITNITYQYYLNTSQYCEWQNGSGSGWCEKDWSIAETCFNGKNQTHCNNLVATGGQNCTWTKDTWCSGTGNSTDWCTNTGGWCDHPDFKPKDCWQYSTNSTCSTTSGCSWRADQWSQSRCEVNWSNNCWNSTNSSACGSISGCSWRNDTWGGWCDNSMGQCWNKNNETACNTASSTCGWRNTSSGGECQPKCFGSDASTQTTCSAITGCVWKSDSGWCEEQQAAQCSNSTLNNNQTACQAASGCRWKNPGWCSPKDGFNAGGIAGSGGVGGSAGSECYKYDGNQTACTNSSLIGTSCAWTTEESSCEVDWSRDCWSYSSEVGGCNATNGCWWNSIANPAYCTNIMDQCWQNQSLQNNATACNANAYCNSSQYGCEPTCFQAETQGACGAGCKWITGLCDPTGSSKVFDGMEKGAPTPLGVDIAGDTNQSSVDILGFGMKDMGDAYGFGIFVSSFVNSSVCNKEKIKQGGFGIPLAEVTGAGNETVKFIVYLDSDGSTTGSCTLDSNSSALGYEFKLVYSSVWNSSTSKAVEALTSYKCESNNWKISDIKISTTKKIMCGEIGGPMIAIDKAELSKYPTLYDSSKNLRVYVSTVGNSGNITSPSDTAGPGWATPGTIDFEIKGCFEFGADSAKFENILKNGFTQYEDCFKAGDEDNDGASNCNDWNCQFFPSCLSSGVNAANYTDTTTPQVTGIKIEEYTDSALVIYDTNKPANGTLEFYKNDSTCSTLNATVYDIGINSTNIRDYKLWHTAEVYSSNIGFTLSNDTTYYYKLKVCDDNGKCAISKCSSFITAQQNKCGFCNFVTRIKVPTGWIVSYDDNQDGIYEHTQGQICGSNSGMKSNYTMGRAVNIKLAKSDGSTYFEFVNASLTKTGLNDKVRTISTEGDIISSSSIVGLTSNTRDKIINNLHPEVCRIKIPGTGTCTSLFHCDDDGNNCVDRTAEATLIDSTNCVWQIPNCEFSTYKKSAAASSSTSSGGSGGGSGGAGGAASGSTFIINDNDLKSGFTKQLALKDKFKFNVSGEYHLLEVTSVTSSSATVKVTSEPQTATLSSGETRKFELTGDNFYDLSVTLNKAVLSGNNTNNTYKAEITVKSDSSPVPIQQESPVTGEVVREGDDTNIIEEPKEKSILFIFFIFIILVILGFVIIYVINRKKNKIRYYR